MVRLSQTEVLPGAYFRITELSVLVRNLLPEGSCYFLLSYGLNRSLWLTACFH